jgi:M42 glutamyl aminopeptidase
MRSRGVGCPDLDSHPAVRQHSAVPGPRFSVGTPQGGFLFLLVALLSARPPVRLSGQSLDQLAVRFASMTAVTGLEQAMTDSLLALLPGSTRDRAGNVTLTLGQGAPKRLLQCPLDEVGYVVGNITADGYVLLRRVGARTTYPLLDQLLEGHRVTVFGTKGAVPGVVAVKSTHLTRGRVAPGAPPSDPVFTVDNAYVDVGAASSAEARALGIELLAPVSLAKRPISYGDRLLAAPDAGRRAACAAVAALVQAKPRTKGTVVVAFTVQSLYAGNAGLASVKALLGPFQETKTATLPSRYTDTAVETVALGDAEALVKQLETWMEGR